MSRGWVVATALAATDQHKKLPGVFGSLEPTLHHYGYLAVFGLLFLENLGIPLPGETILIAAALYAAQGQLNIVLVGVIAVAGSVLGSCAGYAISRTSSWAPASAANRTRSSARSASDSC